MILSPLPIDQFPPEYRLDGNPDAPNLLLFAHGAGAGMEHPFMTSIASAIASEQIAVIRFEFPYMIRSRDDGKKRPPDRLPKLQEAFESWIETVGGSERRLFLGGKSLGGRVACCCADTLRSSSPIEGVIAFGYPFHPIGKKELHHWRLQPLEQAKSPILILQGERDGFGNQAELSGVTLPEPVQLRWLPDGDHSFVTRKASGIPVEENLTQAATWAAQFILGE